MCDALFAVLAFWVFPVLLPLCGLHCPRRGSDARRTQLPLFLLLSLGIGVAVIAWSITVREDLGSPSPRQHTRYLEPLLIPLLAVTLDTLDEKLTKNAPPDLGGFDDSLGRAVRGRLPGHRRGRGRQYPFAVV